MAEAAITFLLEKLKEVVIEYKDLISGAENEFQQLESDLGDLKAFLRGTADVKEKPPPLKEMEKKIREVVYEVEDTIDTCLTKVNEAKAKAAPRAKQEKTSRNMFGIKRSGRQKHTTELKSYDLALEVKSLREKRVMPVFNKVQAMLPTLNFIHGSGGVDTPETEHRRIRPRRIVGFEDVVVEITSHLIREEEKGLDVIPIIGIPGQGKTTLTMMIYEDEFIGFHFPIRIWVYISEKFNIKDFLLQILNKFTPSQPKDTSKLEFDELVRTVRECLEKEKFLLVLDDVWSVDDWQEIKKILPLGNTKSKVLITSRDEKVGRASLITRNEWHQLRFLKDSESWQLLEYEVFGDEKDYPDELKGMGQHIANNCEGVPLTIVVLGGILRDHLPPTYSITVAEKEWQMVAENMSTTLGGVQLINDVVELSYKRLLVELRDCFAYIGVFPEDYEISVKMLLGLWIAEGYIQRKDGKSLEQTAEEYLNDLISRNLVKVEKRNKMGKPKTCRVHDVIRAFCLTKSKDETSFQEIKELKETGELQPPVSEVSKFHRLSFQSGLPKFLDEEPKGPHVRSLLCFYKQQLKPQYTNSIHEGFPKLRILESKSIIFKCPDFPAKLTALMHLRYLTLCIENLTILPKPIGQLWNLQTLVVETTLSHSITMEANMWKMIWLRHVQTKAALVLNTKNWVGEAGQNLQTLGRLSADSCTEEFASKAKGLKTLVITGKLVNIFDTNFLAKLLHLEKLKLVSKSEETLHHIPRPNCFPPNLTRLTLVDTALDWEEMSVLATIRTLQVLKLKGAFTGLTWKIAGYTFPNLQFLLIMNLALVIWKASDDSFPSLKFLVVNNCHNLLSIPLCLGKYLETLDILCLRESAVKSANDIAESRKGEAHGRFTVPFTLNTGAASNPKESASKENSSSLA